MELTATNIKQSLQIFNACASKKGAEYIRNLSLGKNCSELFSDATLMAGLIDSIKGINPAIDTCISAEKIQIILNKLSVLCSTACENIVNFSNNNMLYENGNEMLYEDGNEMLYES